MSAASNMQPPGQDRIRSDAAKWFAKSRSGAMTKADRAALQAWIDEDVAHSEAYLQISGLWDASEHVRADPAVLAMRESALSRYPAAQRQPRPLLIAAWVAGAAAAALLGVNLVISQTAEPAFQVFRTGVGQTASIGLIDGSRLTLDTDTTVRARMSGRKRLIYLDRGRAYFKVAHDKSRPFIVEAAGKSVTATGTAFQVTADAQRFEVLLVEGSVRVKMPTNKTTVTGEQSATTDLTPGTRLSGGPGAWTLTKVDDQDELGWMDGQLVFHDKPLGAIVADMNRYSRRKIVIDNPKVADRLVYGAFMAGDVDQFVRALVDYRAVSIKSQNEGAVVLTAP